MLAACQRAIVCACVCVCAKQLRRATGCNLAHLQVKAQMEKVCWAFTPWASASACGKRQTARVTSAGHWVTAHLPRGGQGEAAGARVSRRRRGRQQRPLRPQSPAGAALGIWCVCAHVPGWAREPPAARGEAGWAGAPAQDEHSPPPLHSPLAATSLPDSAPPTGAGAEKGKTRGCCLRRRPCVACRPLGVCVAGSPADCTPPAAPAHLNGSGHVTSQRRCHRPCAPLPSPDGRKGMGGGGDTHTQAKAAKQHILPYT